MSLEATAVGSAGAAWAGPSPSPAAPSNGAADFSSFLALLGLGQDAGAVPPEGRAGEAPPSPPFDPTERARPHAAAESDEANDDAPCDDSALLNILAAQPLILSIPPEPLPLQSALPDTSLPASLPAAQDNPGCAPEHEMHLGAPAGPALAGEISASMPAPVPGADDSSPTGTADLPATAVGGRPTWVPARPGRSDTAHGARDDQREAVQQRVPPAITPQTVPDRAVDPGAAPLSARITFPGPPDDADAATAVDSRSAPRLTALGEARGAWVAATTAARASNEASGDQNAGGSGQRPSTTPGDAPHTPAQPAMHVASFLPDAHGVSGDVQAPGSEVTTSALPNADGVAKSIVQAMRVQWRNGVGTAVVNLDPEYLGAVSIALRVERGAVTATLHADNADVRAWIEGHEAVLRQGLSDQGLSLERLLVSGERVSDEDAQQDRRRRSQRQPPPPGVRGRAQSSTFEVVV